MQDETTLRTASDEAHVRKTRAQEIGVALRSGLKLGASLLVTWSIAIAVKLEVPSHLGPLRNGQYAFADSFASMFFLFIGFGVDTYVMKEVSVRPKHASDIAGGLFALRALMAVVLLFVMAGVLWITRRPTEIIFTSCVYGLGYFIVANNGTFSAFLQATSYSGQVAIANVVSKVVWGIGLLTALHYNAPLAVLALALPVSDLLKTAIYVPATRRALGLRYRIDISAVRKAIAASAPYFVNALALGALGNLGMSVLEFIRKDPREVGWFAAVQNLSALCGLLTPLLQWVIMPLMSRAYARSKDEGSYLLRRCLEGLVIPIAPLTVLVSAGSAVLVHAAFGDKFAPAATGLSILSLVFVMTYVDTTLAIALIITGRGWSVTLVSLGSVLVNAILMIAFVPIGRHFLPTGGECAGAAASVIATEVFVFAAMVSRFERPPLDARSIKVLVKSAAVGALVLALDHRIRSIGAVRLVVDAVAYAVLALGVRIVRIGEVRGVVRMLRHRSVPPPSP
jgi:O-antigen/teichoic acid export membrane protein